MQAVECSYQISGSYATTPRVIFYALMLFSLLWRKHKWAITVAVVAVMVYSSTTSIHAIVLAAIHQKLGRYRYDEPFENVFLGGKGLDGPPDTWDGSGPMVDLWIALEQMVWDNDDDPVLLVVSSALFFTVPMQLWSKTIRQQTASHKVLFFSWTLLLAVGALCSLVVEQYVNSTVLYQLRFCPLDSADELPITNPGDVLAAGSHRDPYSWNRTVWDYFAYKNATLRPSTICLYPCFDFDWPLRDRTDIRVDPGTAGLAGQSQLAQGIILVLYIFAVLIMTIHFTVIGLAYFPELGRGWKPTSVRDAITIIKHPGRQNKLDSKGWLLGFALRCWLWFTIFYSIVLSPIIALAMIAFFEWFIRDSDPGEESFRHIGQWGVLASTLLICFAAVVASLTERKKSDDSTEERSEPQVLAPLTTVADSGTNKHPSHGAVPSAGIL
jgi:hypothetical protein